MYRKRPFELFRRHVTEQSTSILEENGGRSGDIQLSPERKVSLNRLGIASVGRSRRLTIEGLGLPCRATILHALHSSHGTLAGERNGRTETGSDYHRRRSERLERSDDEFHRRNDNVGPEPRAITAHTPALVFNATLQGGNSEFPVRLAGCEVFRCIEDGEVPANDFVSRVSLDFLRAAIPRSHMARRIKHENRVIRDGVNRQTVTLLDRDARAR